MCIIQQPWQQLWIDLTKKNQSKMLEWIWKKCNGRELFNYCNACFYVTLGLFIIILIGITFWTFSRPIYGSAIEIEYKNSDYSLWTQWKYTPQGAKDSLACPKKVEWNISLLLGC